MLGNVVEHVAAEPEAGRIVSIGTRLKSADQKITEIEINFDDGTHVNATNLIPYDLIFNTVALQSERSSREELQAISNRYFQRVTDHKPVKADYDARCDRSHRGHRITHNGRNGIEAGTGDDGCSESNLGQSHGVVRLKHALL